MTLPERFTVTRTSDNRASCNTFSVTSWLSREINVNLRPTSEMGTIFHEYMHGVEATDRSRGIRASAFLDARTAGEKSQQLSVLTGSSSYEADEVSRPDKLPNAYAGKDYGHESDYAPYFGPKAEVKGAARSRFVHSATEISTMGVQELSEVARASRLLRADADYFHFALGQLGGY